MAEKKPFVRPKDWERTLQRSYSDKDKDYTGKPYVDEEEEKKRKQLELAKKNKFPGLSAMLFGE